MTLESATPASLEPPVTTTMNQTDLRELQGLEQLDLESQAVIVVEKFPHPKHPLPNLCDEFTLPEHYSLALLNGSPKHREDLYQHWLKLSGDDRRCRFFSQMTDEALLHRIHSLDFAEPRILGIYNAEQELVACGEWARDFENPSEAECAFSCNKSERGRGLSKLIGKACFYDAAQFGVFKARIETLRENASARALAESLGAKWISSGDGYGVARAILDNAFHQMPCFSEFQHSIQKQSTPQIPRDSTQSKHNSMARFNQDDLHLVISKKPLENDTLAQSPAPQIPTHSSRIKKSF